MTKKTWTNEYGIDVDCNGAVALSVDDSRPKTVFDECLAVANGDIGAAIAATQILLAIDAGGHVVTPRRGDYDFDDDDFDDDFDDDLWDDYDHRDRDEMQATLSVLDAALKEMQPMRSAALSILL